MRIPFTFGCPTTERRSLSSSKAARKKNYLSISFPREIDGHVMFCIARYIHVLHGGWRFTSFERKNTFLFLPPSHLLLSSPLLSSLSLLHRQSTRRPARKGIHSFCESALSASPPLPLCLPLSVSPLSHATRRSLVASSAAAHVRFAFVSAAPPPPPHGVTQAE